MKNHLCKTCGEVDPEKFRGKQKGTCRVCSNEQMKQYNKDNKKAISRYNKQWRQDNKEVINEQRKQYYLDNKEYLIEYNKQWRQDNKEAFNEYTRRHKKERILTDPGFKYLHNLRVRQYEVLKGKISTTEGLGYNTQELRDYFESLFQEGMTHENHGEWHIDHKIPLSSMELDENGEPINSEYNRKLIHYTNLQPLWAEDNLAKGDKIFPELLEEFLKRSI